MLKRITDASKFGASYLSKFGWDASAGVGLGATGEGRTSHIKVSQKVDMMGIGAAHQKDPNGIAWKQNKDYENLLKRLNDSHAPPTITEVVKTLDADAEPTDEKAERKRKRRAEKEEKRSSKKRKANVEDEVVAVTEEEPVEIRKAFVPRHRACVHYLPFDPPTNTEHSHRARAIAAKSFSSHSSASISEILGISSTDTSAVHTPQLEGSLTPLNPDEQQRDEETTMHKLTTSTKSVADYFKDRLLAKRSTVSSPLATVTRSTEDDGEERPRGLGMGGLGFKPAAATADDDASVTATGISKFGSLMSSMFLAAASSETPTPEVVVTPETDIISEETSTKKKRKRKGSEIVELEDDSLLDKDSSKKNKTPTLATDEDEDMTVEKKEKKRKKKRETEKIQEAAGEVVENPEDKEERRRRKAEKRARRAASS